MTSPGHFRGTVKKALAAVTKAFGKQPPDVAIVLGSGLGAFAEQLTKTKRLSYAKIPGFPKPTVAGHAGECVVGMLGTRRVLVFRGRFHYYEGHSLPITTLPIRVAGAWGVKTLIVTNAAGCLRKEWRLGSLMLIRDHINHIGTNPLRGPNLEEFGPRFPDMSEAYDGEFRVRAKKIAKELGIDVKEGVYTATAGPSYETPAEIRALAMIGADAVGMSTIPEVIVARHHGMRVLGVSCLTNYAAGLLGNDARSLNHEEVIETGKAAERDFTRLLAGWIESL